MAVSSYQSLDRCEVSRWVSWARRISEMEHDFGFVPHVLNMSRVGFLLTSTLETAYAFAEITPIRMFTLSTVNNKGVVSSI